MRSINFISEWPSLSWMDFIYQYWAQVENWEVVYKDVYLWNVLRVYTHTERNITSYTSEYNFWQITNEHISLGQCNVSK